LRALVLAGVAACASPPPICTHGQEPRGEPLAPDPVAGFHVLGHAHNDYAHARPLFDALDHHFYSVEADVWYDAGQLSVSHDGAPYVGTLEDLYLDPLASLVAASGSVHGDGVGFRLVIDIKDDNAALPGALHDLLARYPMVGGAVSIVATGNATMKRAFVDLSPQLGTRDSNHFSATDPVADEKWTDYALDWTAYVADDQQLGCLADDAHALGRKLRLWNTDDNRATWSAELDAGVDYINTDDLAGLDAFLDAP
jgi:hypothetical protein